MQLDSLNELPEEKRPPDLLIWDGKPEDVNKWIKDVFSNKKQPITNLIIKESEIEG